MVACLATIQPAPEHFAAHSEAQTPGPMQPPSSSRIGLACLVGGMLAVAASTCAADRLLLFSAHERTEAGVRIGEVLASGEPVIRLRSEKGTVLPEARKAADALRAATVAVGQRPSISVAPVPDGLAALRVGNEVVVVADKETARLTGMTPTALAISWQKTIETALREPYLALTSTDSVTVPVGEDRYLQYGGPLGKSLAVAIDAADVAQAAVEPEQHRIRLRGVSPGMTLAALRAGGESLLLDVEVKFWAAVIEASAEAELTGSGHDEQLARKVAINAALAAAHPRPGARLGVAAAEREGSHFRVAVTASGEDYLEAKKAVSVRLRWSSPPTADPVDLMVSNSPERIHSPGCVMRENLAPDRPARLLYHHVNATGGRVLFTVKIANPSSKPAAAHVIIAESGPGTDELGVGHTAAVRFWEETRTGSGYVLRIPPAGASDIVRVPAADGTIVSGLAQLTPMSPAPLYVEVAAERLHEARTTMWVEPLSPEDYRAPKLTGFVFGASKRIELEHEIGGQWTFLNLGGDGSVNHAGTHLAGDYGVLHEIDITVTNPTGSYGRAEIAVRASAGVMKGTFLINGELHETGLLRGFQEDVLLKHEVPPQGRQRFRIETMPESASNYPVHLVVRSVAAE